MQTAKILNKGEKTRAGIVECAGRLFYEHGYEGTSFSDIVEASGLFRGNIYHYFKTKDEILRAVIDAHLGVYREMLVNWDAENEDAKVRLLAFIDMITGRKAELVEFGCPIGSLNTELAKDRRDLQQAARALFELFRNWLTACFKRLGKGAESESLALHLLGRAQGVAVISHVYRDAKLLRHEIKILRDWINQL